MNPGTLRFGTNGVIVKHYSPYLFPFPDFHDLFLFGKVDRA